MKLWREVIAWAGPAGAVPHAALVEALRDSGLDETVAHGLAPRHAFARACRRLSERRIIHPLAETAGAITFKLTRAGTLERAAARVRVVRHKLRAYSEPLAGERERLEADLAEAAAELRAKAAALAAPAAAGWPRDGPARRRDHRLPGGAAPLLCQARRRPGGAAVPRARRRGLAGAAWAAWAAGALARAAAAEVVLGVVDVSWAVAVLAQEVEKAAMAAGRGLSAWLWRRKAALLTAGLVGGTAGLAADVAPSGLVASGCGLAAARRAFRTGRRATDPGADPAGPR